jgi:hypothetical protein
MFLVADAASVCFLFSLLGCLVTRRYVSSTAVFRVNVNIGDTIIGRSVDTHSIPSHLEINYPEILIASKDYSLYPVFVFTRELYDLSQVRAPVQFGGEMWPKSRLILIFVG